jgi:hypothetical protein
VVTLLSSSSSQDSTILSATVAGPTTPLRPMRSYTTLRDVTVDLERSSIAGHRIRVSGTHRRWVGDTRHG